MNAHVIFYGGSVNTRVKFSITKLGSVVERGHCDFSNFCTDTVGFPVLRRNSDTMVLLLMGQDLKKVLGGLFFCL